jgi:hypothetical protein
MAYYVITKMNEADLEEFNEAFGLFVCLNSGPCACTLLYFTHASSSQWCIEWKSHAECGLGSHFLKKKN